MRPPKFAFHVEESANFLFDNWQTCDNHRIKNKITIQLKNYQHSFTVSAKFFFTSLEICAIVVL